MSVCLFCGRAKAVSGYSDMRTAACHACGLITMITNVPESREPIRNETSMVRLFVALEWEKRHENRKGITAQINRRIEQLNGVRGKAVEV